MTRRRRWQETWDDFELWMALLGFEREVRFRGLNGKRRWQFDFARPDDMLALEYDGFGRGKDNEQARGGHETRSGVLRDAEKGNEAQLLGWRVLRCHAPTIESGACHEWVERAVRGGGS